MISTTYILICVGAATALLGRSVNPPRGRGKKMPGSTYYCNGRARGEKSPAAPPLLYFDVRFKAHLLSNYSTWAPVPVDYCG